MKAVERVIKGPGGQIWKDLPILGPGKPRATAPPAPPGELSWLFPHSTWQTFPFLFIAPASILFPSPFPTKQNKKQAPKAPFLLVHKKVGLELDEVF